jgi:hypothetical protein
MASMVVCVDLRAVQRRRVLPPVAVDLAVDAVPAAKRDSPDVQVGQHVRGRTQRRPTRPQPRAPTHTSGPRQPRRSPSRAVAIASSTKPASIHLAWQRDPSSNGRAAPNGSGPETDKLTRHPIDPSERLERQSARARVTEEAGGARSGPSHSARFGAWSRHRVGSTPS